jgi:hypothetical protein
MLVCVFFSDHQKIQNEVGSIPYEAVSRDGYDRAQEWNPGASPLINHFFRGFWSRYRLLLDSQSEVQIRTIDQDFNDKIMEKFTNGVFFWLKPVLYVIYNPYKRLSGSSNRSGKFLNLFFYGLGGQFWLVWTPIRWPSGIRIKSGSEPLLFFSLPSAWSYRYFPTTGS